MRGTTDSQRAYIERNTIALFSNYQREAVDARPDDWLGHHSRSGKICESGLWNVNHVNEEYDPACLDDVIEAIESTEYV